MIVKAALVGLLYWISMGRAQYFFSFAFRKPVIIWCIYRLAYELVLENAGNTVPALGFALTLVVMGKQKYLPFFVLGFFLYAILGFSMLTGAVIAVCLALIVSLFVQEDSQEVAA